MEAPKIPENDKERLQELYSLKILDTPPEKAYDTITNLVKVFFDVPIVAISLVDAERQWFKSIQGIDVCETGRDVSFCGHTILQDDLFIIEDASQDPRFADNPLVAEAPKIRYYAGIPIKSSSGFHVGTLCIIDDKPRHIPSAKIAHLKEFALLIEKEFFDKRKSTIYLSEIAKIQEMYINNTDQKQLFDYILNFLLKFTGSEYGFIGIILKDFDNQPYLKTYAITNIAWNEETEQFYKENAPTGLEFKNLDTLFGHTIRTGELVVTDDAKHDPRAGGLPQDHPALNTYLGMPIHGKEGLVAMYGLANRANGYDKKLVNNLTAITKIITSIIESLRNISIIDKMAKKDALTDTYNRFFLEDRIKKMISEKNNKFCLLLLDIDNFKNINDYYGHPAGDELLLELIKKHPLN